MTSDPERAPAVATDGGDAVDSTTNEHSDRDDDWAGLLSAVDPDGDPDAAELRAMMRSMLLIRRVDRAWGDAYLNEEVEGIPPSLSTGQEAVATGTCAALRPGDFQFTTHRGQAPMVASGLDPERMLAELYMRRDGYNGGKSYHVTDAERGVIGMGGIVGAQVPVAAGMALARALRGTDGVSLAYFGDGASNEGAVHEAANLAAMWDLPLVLLCENNGYNISQPVDEAVKGPSIAARAAGYGIPGEVVDGNDPLAVFRAVREAAERARDGDGATLIEARTVRLDGHLAHDPQRYRSEGELADAWAQCPIERFRKRLAAEEVLSEPDFERMEASVRSEVESAVAFARSSPFPDPEEAYEDLRADGIDANEREATAPTSDGSRTGGDADRGRMLDRTRMTERNAFRRDAPLSEAEKGAPSFRAALRAALREEMRRDDAVFGMGEDIATAPPFGVTSGLADEFGRDRIRNAPASEVAVLGAAVGAGLDGMRAVVELQFGDFLSVAIDQLTHQAAMLRYLTGGQVSVPLVVRLPCGGGESTGPQHSQVMHSWFVHAPGIKVAVPSTAADAKGLLKTAIRDDDPVLFFEHKSLYGTRWSVPDGFEDPDEVVPFGEAAVRRSGTDVTVVATLATVEHALAAAERLAEEDGVSVEVIDPRTLQPLDTGTIVESVRKTGRLLAVDEAYLPCGIQGEIMAQIAERAFDALEAPPRRLGNPGVPVPFAPPLENEVLPATEDVADEVRSLVGVE
ncbi:dehydrogenase [Halobacteriales archaeon QS_5_70_15]|nr:MAG: dehydrogenase [Halobacteriales archaeon QS_5_70_15]